MEFKKGLPPKNSNNQFILSMKNHPDMVGMWNNSGNSFIMANVVATIHNEELYDQWYEVEFVDDKDIEGYWLFPSDEEC